MKLSSSKFTFEKSAIRLGKSLPLIWNGPGKYSLESFVSVIGYCNAEDLEFRPRTNEFAVMFFDKDSKEEFWIHVDQTQFNSIFKNS